MINRTIAEHAGDTIPHRDNGRSPNLLMYADNFSDLQSIFELRSMAGDAFASVFDDAQRSEKLLQKLSREKGMGSLGDFSNTEVLLHGYASAQNELNGDEIAYARKEVIRPRVRYLCDTLGLSGEHTKALSLLAWNDPRNTAEQIRELRRRIEQGLIERTKRCTDAAKVGCPSYNMPDTASKKRGLFSRFGSFVHREVSRVKERGFFRRLGDYGAKFALNDWAARVEDFSKNTQEAGEEWRRLFKRMRVFPRRRVAQESIPDAFIPSQQVPQSVLHERSTP